MNKKDYKNFMHCTRGVMHKVLNDMREIDKEFVWSDESLEKMKGLSDTITILSKRFYGYVPSLAERGKFIDMYKGE